MAYDFRANQVRLNRIISSGSIPIIIYPSSSAADFAGNLISGFSTSGIGSDVFLYVSGSSNAKTVFGGDVGISGSLKQGVNTIASGLYSHAQGDGNSAIGESSHAEGSQNTAFSLGSHAEGNGTTAQGFFSHTEGFGTRTYGYSSHAEGYGSEAYGTGSLAVGLYTVASGAVDGVFPPTTTQAAFGKYNLQNNITSLFVVGDGLDDNNRHDIFRANSGSVEVTGSFRVTGSVEIIGPIEVTGSFQVNGGITGSLSGTVAGNPFIVGGTNIITNYNSLGQWEITGSGVGSNFWTELNSSTIYTTSSIQIAQLSASMGAIITGSVIHGPNGTASGIDAYSQGDNNDAFGDYSHAEGRETQVHSSATAAHSEGYNTSANGNYSHAEGYYTTAQSQAAHTEGNHTSAGAQYSHAEGGYTTTAKEGSHAEGYGTLTEAIYSHAEGYYATSSGYYSHAEGSYTRAVGDYSHTEGSGSIAHGLFSHAQGYNTIAFSTGSFASGLGTIASGSVDGIDPPSIIQAAFGKYNLENNTKSLFVVGDGLDNNNRHDILRVNSGSIEVTGSIIVNPNFRITGSIHTINDSNPYIIGNGITVNYNSLGQYELTSSGGGTPAGSNTQIQFNDDGAFGASPLLTFNTTSVGNVGVGTLTYLTGAVGYLSGSNINNQAYTLVLSAAVDQGLSIPGFFDPALIVETSALMTQSLMIFDGLRGPADIGGVVLANQAKFEIYSGSWNPAGTNPVVSIGVIADGGNIQVQSASVDNDNVFNVSPSNTAGQMSLKHVGDVRFISGAIRLSYDARIDFSSGSNSDNGFELKPSFRSGGADLVINSGSISFNSSSADALTGNNSFIIQPASDAHKADVVFDRSLDNPQFDGINIRPLYVTMSTTTTTPVLLSGNLLLDRLGPASIGKLDFAVIAASTTNTDYASWTFSTTVRRDLSGATLVLASTELDSILEGTNAASWDVNINSDGNIYCTGSANTINWYAQVTKKMILSSSGLIRY